MQQNISAPYIRDVVSFGAVTLIFRFMLSDCGLSIFLWNLWKMKNFERDFRSGWSAEKSPVVSAGVKTADGNSCLNLRKEEKYEEEK